MDARARYFCPGAMTVLVYVAVVGNWVPPRKEMCLAQEPTVAKTTTLSMRESVDVPPGIVRIGDVCDVRGGNAALRHKLTQLDLIDISENDNTLPSAIDSEAITVTAREVEMRLRLAGFKRGDVSLEGETVCRIERYKDHQFDDKIVTELRKSYAKMWSVPIDDLEIQLTQPVPATLQHQLAADTRIEPILAAAPRLGTQQARIGLHRDGQLVSTVSIGINVVLFCEVSVAAQRLEAGKIVEAEQITFERRPVSLRDREDLPDVIVGQRLKNTIRSGHVLTSADLADPDSGRPIMIKRRDAVEVLVHKSTLRVLMKGAMALEQGRIGDVIQVQNQATKKTLSARVVGPGRVEIRL